MQSFQASSLRRNAHNSLLDSACGDMIRQLPHLLFGVSP